MSQYLNSTPDFGVAYTGGSSDELSAHGDVGYAGAYDRRLVWPHRGDSCFVNPSKCSISEIQKRKTLSMTQVEHVATGGVVKEALVVERGAQIHAAVRVRGSYSDDHVRRQSKVRSIRE